MYRWNRNDFLLFSVICLAILFTQIIILNDKCDKLEKEKKELVKKSKEYASYKSM